MNFGCALCAGILSASIANPTDVLKVRLQALSQDSVGHFLEYNVFKCFRNIYVHEGLRGLWKVCNKFNNIVSFMLFLYYIIYIDEHKLLIFHNSYLNIPIYLIDNINKLSFKLHNLCYVRHRFNT